MLSFMLNLLEQKSSEILLMLTARKLTSSTGCRQLRLAMRYGVNAPSSTPLEAWAVGCNAPPVLSKSNRKQPIHRLPLNLTTVLAMPNEFQPCGPLPTPARALLVLGSLLLHSLAKISGFARGGLARDLVTPGQNRLVMRPVAWGLRKEADTQTVRMRCQPYPSGSMVSRSES